MGNKINPLGFRLGVNKTSSARWYAGRKTYPALLQEDEAIRAAITGDVGRAGISRIDIERAAHNVNVTIYTARPGVVIGRGGESIKALRAKLDGVVPGTVAVNVQEIGNPNINAALVAQRIAEQLERRFAFRRAMKQAVQRTMESGARGVKIRCSGRLGGTEQARPEWYADGRVPLQTLRADIDYGTAEAKTTYGIIGVKAWVFHGEIVGDRTRGRAVLPRPRVEDDKKKGRRRPAGRRRDAPGAPGAKPGPGGARARVRKDR
ncbi:MAG: 30S ribosomal protein S3 [Trueperaceae bacterium]|nr:30S ribosomal protein S3 [Trueperaceae bacterium]